MAELTMVATSAETTMMVSNLKPQKQTQFPRWPLVVLQLHRQTIYFLILMFLVFP